MSIDFSQEEAQTTPLMTTSLLGEDEGEGSLRPKRLTEYIGQEKAKENLSVFIDAAKMRQEPLDHVLLHGPPGLGKTTLSGIIANEMGVHIRITSGPAIEKPGDLAALLTNLNENDILFVDEIHRLNRSVEEILYPAMEDFRWEGWGLLSMMANWTAWDYIASVADIAILSFAIYKLLLLIRGPEPCSC